MLNTASSSPVYRAQPARLLAAWLPPFIWAALIFYASSLPGSYFPPSPFYSADKVLHLGVYVMLGYLVARALGYLGHNGRALVFLACGLCFLYGASDEQPTFTQQPSPAPAPPPSPADDGLLEEISPLRDERARGRERVRSLIREIDQVAW